ncbi:MAG TPA: carboxypeptidase regulatory-like domain-containing protein [Candidatus Acidoferrales bacterium]
MLLIVSAALTGFAFAQQKAQQANASPAATGKQSGSGGAAAGVKPPVAARNAALTLTTGTQKLPLRRVVLYKSGIGYFQHDGRVRGNEDVEIDLTSGQLNDVLKSLTALDFSGGRIVGASYNSQEPAGHQLASLPVPVAQNSTLGSLLRDLRGARLEVRAASGSFTGRLLSVEQKSRTTNGSSTSQVDQISLLDDAGDVRSFTLEPGVNVRFADRDLEMELTRALGLLDSSHQEDTRHLVLSTAGSGDRQIRVSYISEVPVWKTTYRIVLPGATSPEGTKPLLQGWAVVDNTVGEDWNDVELSLAAGAPQSFIQQLSQPYYMQRPTVGLPRGVLLSPQTHESTIFTGTGGLVGQVIDPDGKAVIGATVRVMNDAGSVVRQMNSGAGGRYAINDLPAGQYKVSVTRPNFKTSVADAVNIMGGRTFELPVKLEVGATNVNVEVTMGQQVMETQNTSTQQSVTSGRNIGGGGIGGGLGTAGASMTFDGMNGQDSYLRSEDGEFGITNANNQFHALSTSVTGAQGGSLGDLFEYKLKDRVTIRKNQSALVPIVQTEIGAEKVALWNANLGMARPLRALWLQNSSDLVLDGGSFNVIEAGVFAGEGLIESIHPGEKRLISYAADLAMQVVLKSDNEPEILTRVHVANGNLIRTTHERTKTTYTIRNEDTSPRTVIIEQPIRSGWKLVEDLKPAEESATAYRFRVEVKSKETKDFVVEEDHPHSATIKVSNISQQLVETYVRQKELTPEMEKFFRQIVAQKDAIAKLDADLKQRQEELNSIGTDQSRVREDLQALKGTVEEKALAQRYVKELDEQETRLAALKQEIIDLQGKRKQAQQELNDTIEHAALDERPNANKED